MKVVLLDHIKAVNLLPVDGLSNSKQHIHNTVFNLLLASIEKYGSPKGTKLSN